MARDRDLEELLSKNLAGTPGLTQKAMFGGMAWLVNGNLLCGASDGGMLVRLGKDNDAWALKIPGVALMVMQGRKMNGWVRATPHVYGDDPLREKLLNAALEFNRTLPKK
jgi:TfoX/Sxy family transcriptional regulator of competence genes